MVENCRTALLNVCKTACRRPLPNSKPPRSLAQGDRPGLFRHHCPGANTPAPRSSMATANTGSCAGYGLARGSIQGNASRATAWHHVLSACIEGIPTQVRCSSTPSQPARKLSVKTPSKVAIARFEDGRQNFSPVRRHQSLFPHGAFDRQTRLQSALDAPSQRPASKQSVPVPELTFTPDIAARLPSTCSTLLSSLFPTCRRWWSGATAKPRVPSEQPDTRNRALLLAHDGSQLMLRQAQQGALQVQPDGPDWANPDLRNALKLPCPLPTPGWVGLAICKDLFDGSISDLLHAKLDLDWLLVPSMSDKFPSTKEDKAASQSKRHRVDPRRQPDHARQGGRQKLSRADTCSRMP